MSNKDEMDRLSIRCKKKDKELITKAAKRKNKSVSQYVLDCSMAELERKTDKMKKVIISRVKKDEKVNKLYYLLEENKMSIPSDVRAELYECIREIGEEVL